MLPTPDDFMSRWGYLGIVVFLVLTGCGLPIPEEVPIVAAGWWASPQQGRLDPWLGLVSCFVGAIVGDIVMYGIGRRFGRRLLQKRAFFAHFLSPEKEQHIEEMFRHHGLKLLFVSRFLIGIRSTVYLTAGILKVPFRRFVLVDMFCAGVMISVFYGLAYFFSNHVLTWIRQAEWAATIVIAAVAAGALVAYRVYRRRRAAEKKLESLAAARTESDVERSVA